MSPVTGPIPLSSVTVAAPVTAHSNKLLSPFEMSAGDAVKDAITGSGTTVTVAIAVMVLPCPSVAVRVYVVVAAGETLTLFEETGMSVVELPPVRLSVIAPVSDQTSVVLCPGDRTGCVAAKLAMLSVPRLAPNLLAHPEAARSKRLAQTIVKKRRNARKRNGIGSL